MPSQPSHDDPTPASRRGFLKASTAAVVGGSLASGLAIARGFAESMGGTVSAEPTPGGGATLVISLRAAS